MKRWSVLGAGVVLGATVAVPTAAWAAEPPVASDAGLAAVRAMFTFGA